MVTPRREKPLELIKSSRNLLTRTTQIRMLVNIKLSAPSTRIVRQPQRLEAGPKSRRFWPSRSAASGQEGTRSHSAVRLVFLLEE